MEDQQINKYQAFKLRKRKKIGRSKTLEMMVLATTWVEYRAKNWARF